MTRSRSSEQRARVSWTPTAAAVQQEGPVARVRPTLEHFVEFAAKLRLDNGKPFIIEPFQRDILADYFAGVLETLVLLPSGNGKTTLYAALGLYHLIYTDDPEAFILAASRDQAKRMHKHIVGFIDRSRQLQRLVRPLSRSVELRHRQGSIEVLSADAGTSDGIGGTLVLVDELHRWPNDELYVVALKGLKKRRGQMLHCSTAGETMQSPLGELRQRCLELPDLTREGMYSHARSADNTLAYHEFALAIEDDAHDMAVVKQANPLASITEADLAAEHRALKWWDWARFSCGLWVAGQHSAFSPLDWAACQYRRVTFDPQVGHFLAVDLAWVSDCTAITAAQAVSHFDVRLKKVKFIQPSGDGTALREEQIVAPIRDWKKKHPKTLLGIVIDPEAGGRSLIEKFEDLGVEVITHSQKNEPMCDAYGKFEAVIRRRVDEDLPEGPRVLQVETDPELTRHIMAAEAKTIPGIGAKLVKRRKNPEHIDGAVSSEMAVRVALAELDPEDVAPTGPIAGFV